MILGIFLKVTLLLMVESIGTMLNMAQPTDYHLPLPVSSKLVQVQQEVNLESDEDVFCLVCHAISGVGGELADGEVVPLYIDIKEYQHSVHGPAGVKCVECHIGFGPYPHHAGQAACSACHPEEGNGVGTEIFLPFDDGRAMSIALNDACRSCHEGEFDLTQMSVHDIARERGNREAPLCVDCHGGHDITPPNEPRIKISKTCAQCHKAVYSTYESSVHGQALVEDSNPDVPTCIDCHGVHSVSGPRDTEFNNQRHTICGECHNDKALMEKYGISTDVFSTYLDDFHGRTVDLFSRQDTGLTSNKAVCSDCHGIHDILRTDDPRSSVYPDNLQDTCRRCHQDISIRFPDAWLSHYVPTYEKTPALFVVNGFYQSVVPLLMVSFVTYVTLDVRKKRRQTRRQLELQEQAAQEQAAEEQVEESKDE